MKVIRNTGTERVIDELRGEIDADQALDMVTAKLSAFAFAELHADLARLKQARIVLPAALDELEVFGGPTDRPARNQLRGRQLAGQLAAWIERTADVRTAATRVP